MAALAKRRAAVVLKDGRKTELLYWPLPEGVEAKNGRRRRGKKGVVKIGETHLSVTVDDIDRVIAVWDDGTVEVLTWS
jgi:hypothetical protein